MREEMMIIIFILVFIVIFFDLQGLNGSDDWCFILIGIDRQATTRLINSRPLCAVRTWLFSPQYESACDESGQGMQLLRQVFFVLRSTLIRFDFMLMLFDSFKK